MKAVFLILFIAFSVACGLKHVPIPINKNANVAFINMEGGGVRLYPPVKAPAAAPAPITPPTTKPTPAASKAVLSSPIASKPTKLVQPVQPNVQPMKPIQPLPTPVHVNPAPAARPITTPGPGTVKQLVNYYDSQGKASVIRPYSYSQAVKQG